MRNIFSILLLLTAAITAATAAPLPNWLHVAKDGTFRIEEHVFQLVNFDPSFAYKKLRNNKLEQKNDVMIFRGTFPDAAFQADFFPGTANSFRYQGKLTASGKQVEITGLFLQFRISGAPRTLTVDGTAGEYQYGTTVTVEASTTQTGMVFAGWFDGIQIAMPGGDYYIRYDAEIQELWAPVDYDVVSVEGGLSVDIGDSGVFFVADVSTLLGARNAGPVTELTVTNSVGSVTVDLEEVGSGPLMVMMSEMGQTPVGYINDAASGSKMYMMQASTLSPDGESSQLESKVSFAESAPVSGITSYGQRIDMAPTTGDQYRVGYGEGVVAYALGEPDGGSGSSMLIIGAVVVVILVVAVVAVVMMRRRSTA